MLFNFFNEGTSGARERIEDIKQRIREIHNQPCWCTTTYVDTIKDDDENDVVKIIENDTNVKLVFKFPGLSKEDVKIKKRLPNSTNVVFEILVTANKSDEFVGDFSESYSYSFPFNDKSINAKMKNGILIIDIEKMPYKDIPAIQDIEINE